ncbi:hypothetical protein GA0070558_11753 [Micromonospora haikouensis]|uniref:ADP-ribosyltransferase exoenzyme n=1 Tax=Micromonospora haikouensis TaxID=686309 RepID=A0A1C4WPX5_9ACTN|nr:hypothetical protein [Micromonospora haikouensis]SCE98224.1 hypothetical protein GA0070558_11753 [Micromonospora haikouensis]
MVSLLRGRFRGDRDPGGIVRHTVGNAVVLHAEGVISPEAQSLALSVAEDHENDVVVLDLADGMPITSWESMAGALPRRRRGIRLMTCGRQHGPAAMAGQWLSERLNRTVVAPDGTLVRGAAGSLFVHSASDSGWIRFRPGRAPEWDSKRYPAPCWDAAAVRRRASSSTGEIEPLPGGVWIHDTGEPELIERHRDRLVSGVPCHHETMTVLLGCPGTAPLSLDDVMRFWRDLDADSRTRARFVQYGTVDLPDGEALGQRLADLFQSTVVCYTGVPIGTPDRTEFRTVRADASLGWPVFASELGYAPRSRPRSAARCPVVLSHRGPLRWSDEVEPRVYWYAADAVIEVVQAGLWIRPPQVPPNAERVRAAFVDPEHSTLFFDDSVEETAARMRELAADVLARLDERTAAGNVLLPASALAPEPRPAGPALGALSPDGDRPPVAAVPAIPASPAVGVLPPAPTIGTAAAVVGVAAEVLAAEVVAAIEPVTAVGPEPATAVPIAAGPEPTAAPIAAAPGPATTVPTAAPIVPPIAALPEPIALAVGLAPVSPGPASAPPPPTPRPHGTASDATGTAPTPRPPAPAPAPVRRQPVPAPAAAALLVEGRPLTDERAWLRRTLSREFDQLASSVARLLSEHPGMQRSAGHAVDEVLADWVAVRLYLSRRGAAIDAGLRSGEPGPHVPFARCAVAGLSRLPSHRGATVYTTTASDAQWALYRRGGLVTEWGFVNALTAPCAGQDGDVDVLLWSMTARRTALLEPGGEERADDRVLFVPGTSFKILEVRRPEGGRRGHVMMRELGANEIDPDGRVDPHRLSLDELALTTLRRGVDRWAGAEPATRVGPGAAGRFAALPGLVGGAAR